MKCRDIDATPMSSVFVASLSQQCGSIFFFDDCRDKLSLPYSFFCRNKVVKCCDKVQLTPFDNCRDKVFNVATNFPCLAPFISGWFVAINFSMSRHSFFLQSFVLLRQSIFCCDILPVFPQEFFSSFVATYFQLSRQTFAAIFLVLCRDKVSKCRDILSIVFCLNCVTTKLEMS